MHHPATWPIIMEFTHGRPRFTGASLMVNWHEQWFHPIHAGWTPERGHRPDIRRLYVEDGRVRCTDFICFFYLTDVHEGDGGLCDPQPPPFPSALPPSRPAAPSVKAIAPAGLNARRPCAGSCCRGATR